MSERKTREALRQSLKQLANIKYALDQSAIVAVTDRRGIITDVNDKFCQISKYSPEELIGQDHRIVNSGHHPKEFFADLWRTIGSGRVFRAEIRNRAKDGSLYWVDTTIVPLMDEGGGHPSQYVAIRYDITDRKRIEAELRENESLTRLGQMAAVVSHEIKNPLAGLRGSLEILAGRFPKGTQESVVASEMLNRIDSLNRMLHDMLLFARPTAPRLAPVELLVLVRATVAMLKKDQAMRDVEIVVYGGEASALADQNLLADVFLNVLLNASQAMNRRGRITITIAHAGERCMVSIADQGPGIPLEVRDRIFEPFFTTKARGTGLGLSIARRTVESHGGSVAVDCPPDGGTVFRVELPAWSGQEPGA